MVLYKDLKNYYRNIKIKLLKKQYFKYLVINIDFHYNQRVSRNYPHEFLLTPNALAESFNAKIKLFRANLRGVVDKKFFLFRIANLYAYPH